MSTTWRRTSRAFRARSPRFAIKCAIYHYQQRGVYSIHLKLLLLQHAINRAIKYQLLFFSYLLQAHDLEVLLDEHALALHGRELVAQPARHGPALERDFLNAQSANHDTDR